MSAIAEIVAALAADTIIGAVVEGRVADHDVRRSGWEADSTYFTEDGLIRPSLIVADGGATTPPFGHSAERRPSVNVIAIADRSDAGRETVRALLLRADEVLTGWQDSTGAQWFATFRTAEVVDADDVSARLTLTAGAIAATATY